MDGSIPSRIRRELRRCGTWHSTFVAYTFVPSAAAQRNFMAVDAARLFCFTAHARRTRLASLSILLFSSAPKTQCYLFLFLFILQNSRRWRAFGSLYAAVLTGSETRTPALSARHLLHHLFSWDFALTNATYCAPAGRTLQPSVRIFDELAPLPFLGVYTGLQSRRAGTGAALPANFNGAATPVRAVRDGGERLRLVYWAFCFNSIYLARC